MSDIIFNINMLGGVLKRLVCIFFTVYLHSFLDVALFLLIEIVKNFIIQTCYQENKNRLLPFLLNWGIDEQIGVLLAVR